MRSADKPPVQCRAVERALVALAMVVSAGPCFAADPGPASVPAPAGSTPTISKKAVLSAPVTLVDINSASRAQLKTLPGIGDVEASRIIAGRPYFSKADLATKDVIPTGVYLSLKNRIIAIQTQQPKARN